MILICFHALKNRLTVVENPCSGIQGDGSVWPDFRGLPSAILIIAFKQVIGEFFSEVDLVKIDLVYFAFFSYFYVDFALRLVYHGLRFMLQI